MQSQNKKSLKKKQKYLKKYLRKNNIVYDPFYTSYQWVKVRMQVLVKYGPICMCCGSGRSKKEGITINVDHILPRKTHPELALSFDNLQVLCSKCNHGKANWDKTDWRNHDENL